MSQLVYKDQGSNVPGRIDVFGSFVCDGTNAPSVITGKGFTVSAPATGVYTVTLTDQTFTRLVSANVDLAMATGANDNAFLTQGSFSAAPASGSATFTIETQSVDGTAANLATGTVSFHLVLQGTEASV